MKTSPTEPASPKRRRKKAEAQNGFAGARRPDEGVRGRLLDMIQQAIVVIDRDLNVLYVNKAAERLSGWKAEELLGRPVTQFVSAPQQWVDARRRILETGESWSDEMTLTRRDRSTFLAAVEGSPLLSEGGEITGYIAVATDITERRWAEEALRESEEKFSSLYMSMVEGVAVYEMTYDGTDRATDALILDVNPAYERLMGMTRDSVVGRRSSEVYAAKPNADVFRMWRRVVSSGAPESLEAYWPVTGKHLSVTGFLLGGNRFANVFHDITDRKRAEEALRESEDRYRGLFETMREGFVLAEIVFDENGRAIDQRCLDVNPTLEQIIGRKREEMVGRTYREIFPAGNLDAWGDPVVRALQGESVRFEWYGAGTGHYYEIFLHSPRSGQIAALVVNIDERVKAQQTLQETAERLRRACRAGRIGIYEWNSGTDIAYVSPELEELVGLEPGSPASLKAWMDMVHPDDLQRLTPPAELFEQTRVGKQALWLDSEYRVIRPDGTVVWIQSKDALAFESGNVVVRGAIQDITERKRMEAALRESEERLRRAVRSGRIGLFELNISRNTQFWSQETYELFGNEAGSPADYKQWFRRVHPDDREPVRAELAKLLKRASAGERDISHLYRHRVVHDDGTVRWLESRITIDLEGGDIIMRGALRDITEQKQAEEQLERLRSEFYGVISHELKTPLTVIKGSAAMGLSSRRASTNPDEVRELLQVINDQSDRLAELVNNLLDMTRIEAGTFSVETSEAGLGEIVADAVRIFQRAGYAHRIEVKLDRRLPRIEADGRRVVQVLTNLLSNAAKSSSSSQPITIHAKEDVDSVVVSVRDRGVGIAADKLPLLFNKYSRLSETSGSGTGLGLWISASIIGAHGGRLWAESAGANKGATFSFTLPKLGAVKPREVQPLASLRILAVDDEPSILRFVERFLTTAGHQVVTTTDPFRVCGLIKADEPDVLVLDMKMPGKSGMDVLRDLRAFSEVPVVVITATDNEQEVAKARSFSGVSWLPKPFAPDELLDYVTTAGNQSRRSLTPP